MKNVNLRSLALFYLQQNSDNEICLQTWKLFNHELLRLLYIIYEIPTALTLTLFKYQFQDRSYIIKGMCGNNFNRRKTNPASRAQFWPRQKYHIRSTKSDFSNLLFHGKTLRVNYISFKHSILLIKLMYIFCWLYKKCC